jgi:hypothetical protein
MAGPPAALTPRQVADLLAATAATLRAELAALPAAAAGWHPAPGEWCPKEVLGHLIEAERRGFAGRIRAALDEPAPAFAAWDMAAVARARADCAREVAALLDAFAAARAASLALVAGLRDADLRRAGRHPAVGALAIGDLLHEWVHHDRNHVRQVLALGQDFVWPHLGNARCFSRP